MSFIPLPFFKAAKRRGGGGCTWHVTPTGSYSADYETGTHYATAFLGSCDGSIGWETLLSCIIREMHKAELSGIELGFMRIIGGAAAGYMTLGRLMKHKL